MDAQKPPPPRDWEETARRGVLLGVPGQPGQGGDGMGVRLAGETCQVTISVSSTNAGCSGESTTLRAGREAGQVDGCSGCVLPGQGGVERGSLFDVERPVTRHNPRLSVR